MKCIKCGNAVLLPIGGPIRCEVCNLQWTLAEHKDNQDWAVRHIRQLEQRIATLEADNLKMNLQLKEILELLQKVG